MMGKGQRILTTVLWALAVVCMLGLVSTGLWANKKQREAQLRLTDAALAAGVQADDGTLPVLFRPQPFELTDQNGRTVSNESLGGSIWVGIVFFTHCPDICPTMISRLVSLEGAVPDPRVKLVPFSIDPKKDTPEALQRYAQQIQADPERWHFLTGTTEQMYDAAAGLLLTAEPATEETPIVHSGKILLIDADGNVRGIYDHKEEADMSRLANDTRTLLEKLPG